MPPIHGDSLIIDFHAHPVSRDLVRDARNLRLMTKHAECLVPSQAGDFLLQRMDAAGIRMTCLMGPTHGDGIGCTNEMVRALVQAYPGRFIGFAGVDPFETGPGETRESIRTAIQDWGFKGVGEFFGDLRDPRCEVVYRTCIELDVPLLIHCGSPLPSQLMKYGHPDAVDEIAHLYPDLTIVAAHVGMPWALETMAVAARHENVYLDISALPVFNRRLPAGILALCINAGLEDRILFGTDFPLVDPVTYLRLLNGPSRALGFAARVLGLPALTRERRVKLLGGNAARLLKLVPATNHPEPPTAL